jgi:FKBP-type peptidyl-prolyl cis-trans isomerase
MLLGVAIGVLVTVAIGWGAMAWKTYSKTPEYFLSHNRSADKSVVETASGLQYKVLTPGKGAKPTDADVTLINYEGKLIDGTTFDKSEQPTPMPVKGVVPGFSEALKLMTKGGKYRLWIKPSLGYGATAKGPIPANSVLVFDVELVDFIPESVLRQMQQQQMMQQGGALPPGAGAPPPGAPTGK